MQIIDKEVAPHVHVKAEMSDAQLKVGVGLDIVVVAEPLFAKLKDLIPGHFEDGLLDSALEKLKALASGAPVAG